MGSTTTNGLPYPTGDDRVMDGDNAIQALAEALDPPWTPLTLAAGIIQKDTIAPSCRKIAGQVFLRGHLTKQSGGNFVGPDALFTVPAGFRPVNTASVGHSQDGSPQTGRTDITPTGAAQMFPSGSSSTKWVSLDGMSYNQTGGTLLADDEPDAKPAE